MAFHPSRSLRAAAGALVLALIALALLLVVPGGALAAGKCKGRTQAWKVNGKTVCLKTAKPARGHGAAEAQARIKRWFNGGDPPLARNPLKVPAKLLAARGRAGTLAAKLVSKHLDFHKRVSRRAFAAGGDTRGAVVETMSEDGPSVTLDNGVTMSSHVEGTAYADGSQSFDAYVAMKLGQYQVQYRPIVDVRTTLVPEVECPTADGKLSIDYSNTVGGTVTALKGRTVLGAVTQKTTEILHSRGQVGRDAHLQSVVSKITEKNEYYARGIQQVLTTSGEFTISRDGEPVQHGPISATVKIKAASASASQERAAEKLAAANLAASRDAASSLASYAELGRWRMKSDEHKWYDAPFQCADLRFSPDTIAQLAAGKSTGVTAVVKSRNDGGEGAGSVEIQSVSRGKLTLQKASLDPGSPAQLTATAAAPDGDKNTVSSDLIAASTAGRAQAGWYAEDSLNLPEKISGVVAAWTEINGQSPTYFHSWVVYTLANVYVSDSGYISAFYDLTTADQDEVENTLGPASGCRYYAKGSGGTINSGDLELRKAPGGDWKHAIQYDVSVQGTFQAVDCGASPPPPFDGDIVGFLNMAMLGGEGFYGVESNFHMQQTALTYTDPASGRKTTADWILDPGDPQ